MNIAAYILWFLAAVTAVGNWVVLVRWYTQKKRSTMVLLVGGMLGVVGAALHPAVEWYWGLLAGAVDPGCFSLLGVPNLVEWFVRRGRG